MEIDYNNLDKLLNDMDYELFRRDIGRYSILEFLDTQVGYDYLLDGWLKQLEERTGNKSRSSALFFTPIKIANDMLDLLPEDTWSNPDIKILSLCDKNGVFLYLAYLRFMVGLAEKIPNVKARRGHILTLQLYSIAADEKLGDELAFLYTGYYNKDLANILTVGEYDDYIESIKTGKIKKSLMEEFNTMKFDIVVGNPPYNNDIYLDFVTLGDSLSSKYTLMITPAKWQAKGGQKNEAFRQNIVPRMSDIVYYPDAREIFDIGEWGGISYFIVDKNIKKIKRVKNICSNSNILTTNYEEHKESDIILLPKRILNIINKVQQSNNGNKGSMTNIFKDVFKQSFYVKNTDHGDNKLLGNLRSTVIKNGGIPDESDYVEVMQGEKVSGYRKISELLTLDRLNDWKCVTSIIISGSSSFNTDGFSQRYINIYKIKPNQVPKGSFPVLKYFKTENECNSFISYCNTRIVRFLIILGICGTTLTREFFRFVPDPGAFDHIFTDEELYKKYNLTQDEISLIESVIKERK